MPLKNNLVFYTESRGQASGGKTMPIKHNCLWICKFIGENLNWEWCWQVFLLKNDCPEKCFPGFGCQDAQWQLYLKKMRIWLHFKIGAEQGSPIQCGSGFPGHVKLRVIKTYPEISESHWGLGMYVREKFIGRGSLEATVWSCKCEYTSQPELLDVGGTRSLRCPPRNVASTEFSHGLTCVVGV